MALVHYDEPHDAVGAGDLLRREPLRRGRNEYEDAWVDFKLESAPVPEHAGARAPSATTTTC